MSKPKKTKKPTPKQQIKDLQDQVLRISIFRRDLFDMLHQRFGSSVLFENALRVARDNVRRSENIVEGDADWMKEMIVMKTPAATVKIYKRNLQQSKDKLKHRKRIVLQLEKLLALIEEEQ